MTRFDYPPSLFLQIDCKEICASESGGKVIYQFHDERGLQPVACNHLTQVISIRLVIRVIL